MLIMNQKERLFIESSGYCCYAVVPSNPGFTVYASSADKKSTAIKLGWYVEEDEAQEALYSLFESIRRGDDCYIMPDRTQSYSADGYVYPGNE